MKISTIIADDESFSLRYLRSKLEKHCPSLKIIGEAKNSTEIVQLILEKRPDVVFMDIEMPGGNSFEVLQQIPTFLRPHFVFVTAHDQYAIKALREGAFDYLLKPVKSKELLLTYCRIEKKLKEKKKSVLAEEQLKQKISIKHQGGFKLVRLADIVHLKADNNYSLFLLNDGSKIMSSQTLSSQQKIIDSPWFFRIHRSHLINLSHLKEYSAKEGGEVIMSNEDVLPVARSRASILFNQLEMIGSSTYRV